MKPRIPLLSAIVVIVALTLPGRLAANTTSICDAISGNLVANCGFESGSFLDWTTTPAASGSHFLATNAFPNSGSYSALFGAFNPPSADAISQTLATMPGTLYNVDFYLYNNVTCGAGQCSFTTSWDGTTKFTAATTAFPYTLFSFTVLGTGSDTLSFSGYDVPSVYLLDDVSVVPTPEPGTLSLLGAGLLGLIGIARFGRRNAHV